MHILCPTDFSKPAAEAADVAAALGAKRKLPVRLAYCAAEWVASAELPLTSPVDLLAPGQLESEARRLAASGADVTTTLKHGGVAREIVSAAQQSSEMIVMGSTGKGLAGRWLIGSVAERVAESAPVPTLVVRKAGPLLAWLREGRPLRVLCGVDFTVSADAAVNAVKQLTHLGAVEVEAAYVPRADDAATMGAAGSSTGQEASPPEQLVNLERDVWERLHDALGETPVEVHIRSAFGSPSHEFVRLADERKADLVVVGTHQRHGMRRLAAPSFSRGVLHHAATNVLCVPLASFTPQLRVPVIQRVLVAVDTTADGCDGLQHAYGLLPSGGAVRLLHVCPAPRSGLDPLVASHVFFDKSMETTRARLEAEERLQSLIPRQLSTSNVTTSAEVLVHDDIPAAICEAAERFGADVICMSTRARPAAAAIIEGSVTQRVLAMSHKPVFVVTPPRL